MTTRQRRRVGASRICGMHVTDIGCRSCGLWSRGFVTCGVVLSARLSAFGFCLLVGYGVVFAPWVAWVWVLRVLRVPCTVVRIFRCVLRRVWLLSGVLFLVALLLFPKICFATYVVSGLAEIGAVHNDLFGAMSAVPPGTDVLVAATDFRF